MTPVTEKQTRVRYDRLAVRCADEQLADVLRGKRYLVFDGAMGTMLQAEGLEPGALPELMNLEHPEVVERVHRRYVEAGAQVVTTNTFGASSLKLGNAASVDDVYAAAVACARASGARYVAADMGPTGELLEPMGSLSFQEAYELFAEEARSAQAAGADLIIVETMADLGEMKAAVLAAKEHTDLPVFATMTFGENGRTFLGCDPLTAAITLDALGVNALGINCSLGPLELAPLVDSMLEVASCPVVVQANAGLPNTSGGEVTYDIAPADYAQAVNQLVCKGVSIVGGCCGTNPDYIALLARDIAGQAPKPRAEREAQGHVAVTGQRSTVVSDAAFEDRTLGSVDASTVAEAVSGGDYLDVVDEAMDFADDGCDAIVIDLSTCGADDCTAVSELVAEVQGMVSTPLVMRASEPAVAEAAVRPYVGTPGLAFDGSDTDVRELMERIATHYGCTRIGW